MNLLDLNADCLLRIFSYCGEKDLMNLARAHYRLDYIIDYYMSPRTLDLLMCGHRNNPQIEARTHQPLSHAERLSVARNWLQGRYRERQYFQHSQMFAMKLLLERDWLFVSHTAYLRQYRRIEQEPLQRLYHKEIATNVKSDIGDFVKKRDTIFVGRICGSCFIYEDEVVTEQRLHAVKEYLQCVDFSGDLYFTSSDVCSKFWRRSEEFGLVHLDQLYELKNKSFKAVQLSEDGQKLIGGLYTDVGRRALREYDVESGSETVLNSDTISIYDLKLKDDNVIFTANFDTTFRIHDRRTNRDECIWEDPFDSSFYCLDYDGLHGVVCGAKYHSRVNLYDIRVPGKYMQLYFPTRRNHQNSPVYSIGCDSRYLFVATDHSLRVFDFKADYATSRDYHSIFKETHRISQRVH